MHVTLEDMIANVDFNEKVATLVADSGRKESRKA